MIKISVRRFITKLKITWGYNMKKTTKEMIYVMKAFDEGKQIQSRYNENFDDCEWNDISIPSWNWNNCDYRVKPEHKKRPMTFDEIVAYWKEHRTEIVIDTRDNSIGFITSFSKNGNNIEIETCGSFVLLDDFIEYVTKEDGTKFEIEIEEK